ncbi:hypothetical protein T07_5006 [Trichinella nelsoni]|uniref:Uncharacterized protein n=1 Tax=Trichinella nelsoni TaxID=6336 RepID=A0A0V0SFD5_9BILA|nr:hypothetical protein T07_5006 [Trichinella nelsoni]
MKCDNWRISICWYCQRPLSCLAPANLDVSWVDVGSAANSLPIRNCAGVSGAQFHGSSLKSVSSRLLIRASNSHKVVQSSSKKQALSDHLPHGVSSLNAPADQLVPKLLRMLADKKRADERICLFECPKVIRLDNCWGASPGYEAAECGEKTCGRHVGDDLKVHGASYHACEEADVNFLHTAIFSPYKKRTGEVQSHLTERKRRFHSCDREFTHQWTERTSVLPSADDAGSDASFYCLASTNHPITSSQCR